MRKALNFDSKSSGVAPSGQPAEPLPFGVNFAGFFTGENGLGESARLRVEALRAAGVPVVLNNVYMYNLVNAEMAGETFSEDNPYRFNIAWVNGKEADYFVEARGPDYFAGRYNIGYWVWEMEELPDEWLPRFRHFDEIWVPTRFVQEAIARKSPVPVFCTRHPIAARRHRVQTCGALRGIADIPDGSFVFFFVFHFHGNFERKNPMGLIAAFKEALGDRKDAYLVIKCAAGAGAALAEMEEAARGTNIRIINQTLTREHVDRLMEDCDCFVSLHRSEGYGLSMAEAMTYGKPVIATAYSGNLDFMTPENSYLVPYKLVEVEETTGPYLKGWLWAEPDIGAAAAMMRHVYENRDEAKQRGRRASADVIAQLHPAAIGAQAREHLEAIARL